MLTAERDRDSREEEMNESNRKKFILIFEIHGRKS